MWVWPSVVKAFSEIMDTFYMIQHKKIVKLDPGKVLEFIHCMEIDS